MLKQIIYGALGLGLTLSALPARADDKVEEHHQAKRNADGTVDSKHDETRRVGDAKEEHHEERSTSHDVFGRGTTTTVEKTRKLTDRKGRSAKHKVKETIKRDDHGHVTDHEVHSN